MEKHDNEVNTEAAAGINLFDENVGGDDTEAEAAPSSFQIDENVGGDDTEAAASSFQIDNNVDEGNEKIHEHEFESLLSKALFDLRDEFNSRISHLEEGTRETSALSESRNELTGRRNSYYVEVENIEMSVLAEEEVVVEQGQGNVPDSGGVEEFDDKKSQRRRSSCPNHAALEQSTFSLLISEEVGTIPHTFAVATSALSVLCLVLAIWSALTKGTKNNPFGLPVDVGPQVHIAQYVGLVIGVLMGEEVPAGLELLAMGVCQTLVLDGERLVRGRILFYSLLRLVVGYMFLMSLFFNVVQNNDVLGVFFDVLALQFVEHIDDYAFGLARRGFFGDALMFATNCKHSLTRTGMKRGLTGRSSCFIRTIYYMNVAALIIGLGLINRYQNNGVFRCNSLSFELEEKIWHNSIATLPDGSTDTRFLLYSFFSGVYEEDGVTHGHPRYVERNKNTAEPYTEIVGAEIIYCLEIKAWVFRHRDIQTSEKNQNECGWLLRSPETTEYDVLSVAKEGWLWWKGTIEEGMVIKASCNECSSMADCNYNGSCNKDKKCICDERHFGNRCEMNLPCLDLGSRKFWRSILGLGNYDTAASSFTTAYGRPVYSATGLSGKPFAFLGDGKYGNDDTDSLFDMEFPGSDVDPWGSPVLDYYDHNGENGRFDMHPSVEDFKNATVDSSSVPVHPHSHETASVYNYADHDDFFENSPLTPVSSYSVSLFYSGSRWFGSTLPPEKFSEDFHSYWDEALSPRSFFIVSEITDTTMPVEIDWYEMRNRQKWGGHPGPYGVLVPMTALEGTGFFHCYTPWPMKDETETSEDPFG